MTVSGWGWMTGHRTAVALSAALLAALDLGLKAWAAHALTGGAALDLQVIELRLAFNSGMAFGLGDTLPVGVVLGLTGLITAGLAVFIWRAARTSTLPVGLGLAAVLAGAVANLIDRAADGAVTDYLHTGWFPTFNLADVLITTGAAALVVTIGRTPTTAEVTPSLDQKNQQPSQPQHDKRPTHALTAPLEPHRRMTQLPCPSEVPTVTTLCDRVGPTDPTGDIGTGVGA